MSDSSPAIPSKPSRSQGLAHSQAWRALQEHRKSWGPTSLKQLFVASPSRGQNCQICGAGVTLDYSKTHISEQTLGLFQQLLDQQQFLSWRSAMFQGAQLNHTEGRAVLHPALRQFKDHGLRVANQPVFPEVAKVREEFLLFAEAIRSGKVRGCRGDQIDTIVNIGIGGSDLGPAMVYKALAPRDPHALCAHYVSNVDGADIASVLDRISPEKTLFVVASKTFTTQETMLNAETAKTWFLQKGFTQEDVASHFVAVSTNVARAEAFGIQRIFPFWDWVGGRTSLWSSIGLSLALSLGAKTFEDLLKGAEALDDHFVSEPLEKNLPMILALTEIWYINFFNYSAVAILPYDHNLAKFPAYLQQLDMESNGKSMNRWGEPVDYSTSPILFGEPGTNGQHAFYQLLHQGTPSVLAEFFVAQKGSSPYDIHHKVLIANCLAQSQALLRGKTYEEAFEEKPCEDPSQRELLAKHREFSGNKPSLTFHYTRLDAATLGALIAIYEHKVFTQGIIWELNSYDQWGVELGKQLARQLLENPGRKLDSSTQELQSRLLKPQSPS